MDSPFPQSAIFPGRGVIGRPVRLLSTSPNRHHQNHRGLPSLARASISSHSAEPTATTTGRPFPKDQLQFHNQHTSPPMSRSRLPQPNHSKVPRPHYNAPVRRCRQLALVALYLEHLEAQLSTIGLEPIEYDSEGSGWDPERGVWLLPWPLDGGTTMRRVGGVLAVALEGASSEEMVNYTSSMQISTFSSLKSTFQLVIRSNVAIMRRIVPVWITPQNQCM